MTTQLLTTVGLVRAYMQEIHICKDKQITDDDLGWFNCRWLADIILDHRYDAKELARILDFGILPAKNIDSLQTTLDRHWHPQLTVGQVAIADLKIRIQIAKFVDNTKIKSELENRLTELQHYNI